MCDITFEGYQILQTLGQGSFGQVKLGSKDGDLYAIKFSSQSNAYSPEILQKIFVKQTNIIAGLNHPNIIKLYGSYMSGDYTKGGRSESKKAGIIFQYAPHNLGQIMQLGALQQSIARTLFKQMLDGISYLHSNNIIHRDIKPQNILFDRNFNIKICDFGLSTRVDISNKPKTICGSDSFKSPQVLLKKNYNGVMNDLFAAGVTLFILVTGHAPFITAAPHSGQYQFIALNYFQKFWKVHQKKQKYSSQFKNLINSMLAFDPTYRLSISQILSHPWMNSDTLMGDELAQVMRKKVTQIIQKKKMVMLKQMRNRVKKVANKKKQNRALKVEQNVIFQKKQYRKETAKLTDRLIPKVCDLFEVERLFNEMSGQVRYNKNNLELIKIYEDNGIQDKVILRVKVEDYDKDSDCLKFNLIQGNTIRFIDILNEFDEKILSQKQQ